MPPRPESAQLPQSNQQSMPAEQPVAPVIVTSQPQPTPQEPVANWQYSGNNTEYDEPAGYQMASIEPISWTASEYIDHEKNHSWYLGIGVLSIIVAIGAYLLTRDIVSGVVILIAGGLLVAGGARKPRTLQFMIDTNGVQIGEKLYPYANFKSFAIMEEGAFSSIQLMPAQRFSPAVSLYYPPEQEELIVDSLGSFLPHEERQRDPIDRLMRRIKF